MPLTPEQQKSLEALKQKGYSDNQIGQMTTDYANQTGRTQDLENLQENIQDMLNRDLLPGQRVENTSNTAINQQQSGTNIQPQQQTAVENKIATVESQNQQKNQEITPKVTEKQVEKVDIKPINQYQDNSEERMAQITQNLNNYAQTNPELFSDRATFDKAFEYQQRNDKQKIILDSFFNKQKANSYTNGDLVYKDFQNGNLTQADLDNMKSYNPLVYQQYVDKQNQENAKNKFTNSINVTNTMFSNLSGTDTSKSLTAQEKTDSPFQYMLDFIKNTNEMLSKVGQGISYTDYKNLVDNDEVLNKSKTELDGVNTRIIELNSAYKNLEDDMRARIIGGGGVSKSEMLAMVAEKSKPLTRELENLTDQATLITNRIQTRKAEIDKQFEIKQKEVEQQKQDIQNKLQNFSIAYGIYKDQREQQRYEQERNDRWDTYFMDKEFQKQQAQEAFDLRYGNIDSTDPRAKRLAVDNAVSDVMEQFKGWTFQRSKSQLIDSVLNSVNSGKTLGEAMAENITDQLRANPAFVDWLQSNSTTKSENYVEYPIYDEQGKRIGTGVYNKYDPTDNKVLDKITGGVSVTDLSKLKDGTVYGQCGEFVNDYLGQTVFGNSLESKMSKKDSDVPTKVGDVVIMSSPNFPENGHVAIVEKINKDGTFDIVESNWGKKTADGKVVGDLAIHRRRNISPTNPNVKGFYTGVGTEKTSTTEKVGTGTISSLGQYLKDNQNRGQGYSEEDVKAFNEKIDRYIKNNDENGMLLAFRQNLFQDKDFKQEFDNTQKFIGGLNQVEKLISDYEKAGKDTNALKALAERVGRSLGLTTDNALAQLQTQMGFTLASYIKSISGTAASDAEVARLMGNMANISNVSDLNKTIIGQVKENARDGVKSMIDTRLYGLDDSLKGKLFKDIYTTNTNTQSQSGAFSWFNPSNIKESLNNLKKGFYQSIISKDNITNLDDLIK